MGYLCIESKVLYRHFYSTESLLKLFVIAENNRLTTLIEVLEVKHNRKVDGCVLNLLLAEPFGGQIHNESTTIRARFVIN